MSTLKEVMDRLEQLPAHELEKLHRQVQEHRHRLARQHRQAKHPNAPMSGAALTPDEVDALMAEIVADSEYDATHG